METAVQATTKICNTCGTEKPLWGFARRKGGDLGRASRCKACTKIAYGNKYEAERSERRDPGGEARRARAIEVKLLEEHPEYRKLFYIKQRYGLTLKEFHDMLMEQDGRCMLCRRLPSDRDRGARLHIDHDHVTGAVRSLLCATCNIGLGAFVENIALLQKAIDYLQQFRSMAPKQAGGIKSKKTKNARAKAVVTQSSNDNGQPQETDRETEAQLHQRVVSSHP